MITKESILDSLFRLCLLLSVSVVAVVGGLIVLSTMYTLIMAYTYIVGLFL